MLLNYEGEKIWYMQEENRKLPQSQKVTHRWSQEQKTTISCSHSLQKLKAGPWCRGCGKITPRSHQCWLEIVPRNRNCYAIHGPMISTVGEVVYALIHPGDSHTAVWDYTILKSRYIFLFNLVFTKFIWHQHSLWMCIIITKKTFFYAFHCII